MNPTEEGKRLASFISAIGSFYENLSDMLIAAEEMLGKSRWDAATDANCIIGGSGKYNNPQGWRPRDVFRFFKSDDYPHALACICILLEKRTDEKSQVDFAEPLATVAWFDFGEKTPGNAGSNWKLWLSRWYSYSPAAKLGDWTTDEVAKLPPGEVEKNDYRFSFVRGMAVPLAEINSGETLKKKLLDPLLEDISKRSKPARE